jgi:hypothetical protein
LPAKQVLQLFVAEHEPQAELHGTHAPVVLPPVVVVTRRLPATQVMQLVAGPLQVAHGEAHGRHAVPSENVPAGQGLLHDAAVRSKEKVGLHAEQMLPDEQAEHVEGHARQVEPDL